MRGLKQHPRPYRGKVRSGLKALYMGAEGRAGVCTVSHTYKHTCPQAYTHMHMPGGCSTSVHSVDSEACVPVDRTVSCCYLCSLSLTFKICYAENHCFLFKQEVGKAYSGEN